MGQSLKFGCRQQLSCLLITTLTLLSLSAPTTCTSEHITRDVSRNRHKFSKSDLTANNSHEVFTNYETKDDYLLRNDTDSFVDASMKLMQIIGDVHTVYNLLFEKNSDLNSSVSSSLSLLKVISLIPQKCWNKSDVTNCVRDTVIRFMRSVLYSPDSYRISRNLPNNETVYGELLNNMERSITALQDTILKQLRNYEVSVKLEELGNQVEDSSRALLSWFKPGKSL